MGVNISQHKIVGDKAVRTDFDFIRYTGDRDIASTEGFERVWVYLGDPRDDWSYWRPRDLDLAIQWCKEHLCEAAQRRWITEFEKMKTDETLYFYNGW